MLIQQLFIGLDSFIIALLLWCLQLLRIFQRKRFFVFNYEIIKRPSMALLNIWLRWLSVWFYFEKFLFYQNRPSWIRLTKLTNICPRIRTFYILKINYESILCHFTLLRSKLASNFIICLSMMTRLSCKRIKLCILSWNILSIILAQLLVWSVRIVCS